MAKKSNVVSMSIEALFKLRDEIAEAISSRASDLHKQFAELTDTGETKRKSTRTGKKVAPQFRNTTGPSLVW